MSAIFLETSALLRIIFREEGKEVAVNRLKKADRVIASRLIRVESERALIRLVLDHPETQKQVPELERELKLFWPKIDFIEITREICDLAGRISPKFLARLS